MPSMLSKQGVCEGITGKQSRDRGKKDRAASVLHHGRGEVEDLPGAFGAAGGDEQDEIAAWMAGIELGLVQVVCAELTLD